MVLEEEQHASRRAAGAQVPTIGAGEQIDGVNGERAQHDLRGARAMKGRRRPRAVRDGATERSANAGPLRALRLRRAARVKLSVAA
jgi:hypothetical protein